MLPGVADVALDMDSATVTVTFAGGDATLHEIAAALAEIGYPPDQEAEAGTQPGAVSATAPAGER